MGSRGWQPRQLRRRALAFRPAAPLRQVGAGADPPPSSLLSVLVLPRAGGALALVVPGGAAVVGFQIWPILAHRCWAGEEVCNLVALQCFRHGGSSRGGWVSGGAVRGGDGGVGLLRAKAYPVLPAGGVGACGRRITSLEASSWSPTSSYTPRICSSGESLRPGRVGRRRRHRRFPLLGVALKSFGSRLHISCAGRSRHCGRLVPVRRCGCWRGFLCGNDGSFERSRLADGSW